MSTSSNRPARLNRALLALIGLLLQAAGGYAVAAHGGRVPWVETGDRLVPGTAVPPTWVLVVIVIAAIVLGLLCLRWLALQRNRLPRPVSWELATPDTAGTTTLASSVAADAVATEVENYPEVGSVSAVLSGPGSAPELYLVVSAAAGADITALRRRILGEALPRLRAALGVAVIPVTMEFELVDERIALR
ncbi:alkaline shock response membrane anchor protein AmaP [Nocardia sp. NBC_00511]|uniref:alkaline shock response membrane anchor protein AmaP n=1 Tax=Nocardia sp. NBC_00511 TaxID=2903591 RepID=UPI0030E44E2F